METIIESKALREARFNAGLTLQELANLSGVRLGTIQALETDRYKGTIVCKVKLATALKTTLKELFPVTYQETAALLASPREKRKAIK